MDAKADPKIHFQENLLEAQWRTGLTEEQLRGFISKRLPKANLMNHASSVVRTEGARHGCSRSCLLVTIGGAKSEFTTRGCLKGKDDASKTFRYIDLNVANYWLRMAINFKVDDLKMCFSSGNFLREMVAWGGHDRWFLFVSFLIKLRYPGELCRLGFWYTSLREKLPDWWLKS